MKKDDFVDLMGEVDDALIEQVDEVREEHKKNKRRWIGVTSLVACLALILSAGWLLTKPWDKTASQENEALLSEQPDTKEHEAQGAVAELGSFPEEGSVRLQLLNFASMDEALQPSVAPYGAEAGLSNVINLDQFYLSDEKLDLLEKNLFVVSPSYNSEFFETYEYNRYAQIPNYVTVDSMMHTYHLYFSLLLNRTEKNYLSDGLLELSKGMLETSMAQYEALVGTQWEQAAKRNVAYFAIAAELQEPGVDIPAYAAELVQWELEQIYAAEGIVESQLAEDFIDYSQFKPRGYYEGDDVLEDYFRAMMWYGQVNFAQDNEELNRSALLMTMAMAETDILAWEQIYTVTSFFAGVSDDLGYYEYAPIIEEAYGGYPTMELLITDENAYETYLKLVEELPPPAINSVPVYRFEEGDLGEMNKGFRFMGQRFTIDAAIMQQLVYRNVEGTNKEGGYRMLPDTLDVPAVLGSDVAFEILEAQGETEYGGYTENMEQLRSVLQDAPQSSWTTSLYSSWLYTLLPLLEEKGEGYPSYMTSTQWAKKRLETFAGSFTELKHDTVLYAKQMIAEMGGGPPEVIDDRGYVEPEPEIYHRFMLLAQQTREGLNKIGLLGSEDVENLNRLAELARRLMEISNKELQDEVLTDEEYDLIREYGGTLEHFWIEAVEDRTDADYLDPQEIPASLVTDIATDPNGTVLQIGNAKPAEILVVVPIEGKLRLASGVVYNFYQFEQPIGERLTDTEWRQKTGEWAGEDGWFHRDETLEKPWWTESYWSEE
ncbi:MAG: DUF3160 domain-containing protein [Oscillospiraceae bacterium]|nr:DUF3160 domain-containing protein [Oscillospiraceae bacterium]